MSRDSVRVDSNLDEFRHEIRSYIEANCPPSLRTPMVRPEDRAWAGRRCTMNADQRAWLGAMVRRGLTVPAWPREYGGAGLSAAEVAILRDELARIKARPPLEDFGITMLGPALMRFGTAEQCSEHLPRIARGEIRWCQGYSEPNAGSDLASLQCRAEVNAEGLCVSGRKIWTSYANAADWIFCLVRTDVQAPKHRGISFVLIDMTTPGVSVRPIPLISGHSQFCETLFENVFVPRSQVVGPVNGGWDIAKFLLTHERDMYGGFGSTPTGAPTLIDIARAQRAAPDGRVGNDALRVDLIRYQIDAYAFERTLRRVRASAASGVGDKSAFLKYYGTELNQRRHDLVVAAGGAKALGWEGAEFDHGDVARAWLRSRGNSIEGGTTEIQLNIIARRLLGLPTS